MNKESNKKPPRNDNHGPMGFAGSIPEKPKDAKKTIGKLLKYLKPYRLSIFIVIILSIGSALFTIFGPKILGKATTAIFEGLMSKVTSINGTGIDFGYIKDILIFLLCLYILSAIFSFIQWLIMTSVAQKVSYNLRKAISKKINMVPLKYYDTTNHGDILSRVTNDVDTLGQTLNQTMINTITSVTTIIGVLIMMFTINVGMTLIALLVIPISLVIIGFVMSKSQKFFKEQQENLGAINGYVEEIYSGHNIMKAFNREEESTVIFMELNKKHRDNAWKAQFISTIMMPMMTFIGNIGYVGITIAGGWFAIQGKIKVGDILAFIQYVRLFMQPLGTMAQVSGQFQSTIAAAERVFEFLEEEEEVLEKNKSFNVNKVKGAVEFKNVSFGYNQDQTIINDFSIKVKPGQTVAIVGPTGAGKTTIVKLLMRFYDVNSGSILIDKTDINDIKRGDLRNTIGMVLQDAWLFNGSIKDNILYGKSDASESDMIKASEAAHVDHFVHTLPDGYDMIINEEASNISQGQKQLLTIARTILNDPKILILDEATSSVDTRTEVLIQRAMERLMKDRTSFVIAHRLSTIKNADLILVMKDGDIVEHGKHEQLLNASGFYASLYNSQFETTTNE